MAKAIKEFLSDEPEQMEPTGLIAEDAADTATPSQSAMTAPAAEQPVPSADVPLVQLPASVMADAAEENRKRDFVKAILDARTQREHPAVYTPPAPPARIVEQTRLEMEAGAAAVAKRAEEDAARPQSTPHHQTDSVAIFRPADYTQPPLKTNAAQHIPTATHRVL